MKFCPVVPEIWHGQVHVPRKERKKERKKEREREREEEEEEEEEEKRSKNNKGNANRGISPCLKIRP